MKTTSPVRRFAASALLTAGLAYPVCAAVCPKGRGGCPSPGRCFLFVDADGNSLCDYTSRTGSQTASGAYPSSPGASGQVQTTVQATAPPAPDPTAAQVTVTPVPADQAVSGTAASSQVSQVPSATPVPETTTTVIQNTSSGGLLDTIHVSAPVAGAVLFLIFLGIFFRLIRNGMLGTRAQRTMPALMLSSLFALGLSLITTSFLAGDTGAGTMYALVYMVLGTLLAAYLWHEDVMTRKNVLLAAGLGTLAGFAFASPIMPMELGGIVNVATGVSALTAGIMVICAVILLALAIGRIFCGNICPVGSLQEMAYDIPVKKFVVRHTEVLEMIRLAVFVVTVIAAAYLIDVMALTGLYDLFSLTLSAGLIIAAGLVLLSVFLYRPVCRVLCPFGALFSIFAEFSLFRLRRTETCISCRKCEKVCPTRTAGKTDSKRECYLCGRCTEACPVDTALIYRR
jgi:ferredoxin-type protein NapH